MMHRTHVSSALARLNERLSFVRIIADPTILLQQRRRLLPLFSRFGRSTLRCTGHWLKLPTQQLLGIENPQLLWRHGVPQATWEPQSHPNLHQSEHNIMPISRVHWHSSQTVAQRNKKKLIRNLENCVPLSRNSD